MDVWLELVVPDKSPETAEIPTKPGYIFRVDEGFSIMDYPVLDSRTTEEVVRDLAKDRVTVSIQPVRMAEVATNVNGKKDKAVVVTEETRGRVYIDG